MRLIDVDKVDIPIMQRQNNGWVFKCNFKDVLDTLPTVNAIPVDWLRMWFTKEASLIGLVLMGEIESAWEKENGIEESTRNI